MPNSPHPSGERLATTGLLVSAAGTVVLLFWSLTSGMNHSSCKDNIANNPDCNNNGPSARVLLGWAVLAGIAFAAALLARRRMRRVRMVRSGMNFTTSSTPRALLGSKLLRWAGLVCWLAGALVFLALMVAGAGTLLGIAALVACLSALALWVRGLRLKRR